MLGGLVLAGKTQPHKNDGYAELGISATMPSSELCGTDGLKPK